MKLFPRKAKENNSTVDPGFEHVWVSINHAFQWSLPPTAILISNLNTNYLLENSHSLKMRNQKAQPSLLDYPMLAPGISWKDT